MPCIICVPNLFQINLSLQRILRGSQGILHRLHRWFGVIRQGVEPGGSVGGNTGGGARLFSEQNTQGLKQGGSELVKKWLKPGGLSRLHRRWSLGF